MYVNGIQIWISEQNKFIEIKMSRIKIFEIFQRNYATLGISPSHQLTQKYPFNERVLFGFLLFSCTTISQLVYVFHVPSGFMEYINCFCATSGTIQMFIGFAAIVFKRNLLFKTIDDIQMLMNAGESFFPNGFGGQTI